jgi:hypothetical protein
MAESFQQDELIYTGDNNNEFQTEINKESTSYGEAIAKRR